MIEGNQYTKTVKLYFEFLITEFDFKVSEEIINGNYFYRMRYINKEKAITISYENVEDYLSIFISVLQNGVMPDYDDKTKTLHLNRLNTEILLRIDKTEISQNNENFKFNTKNELERKLLKSAKELRLCLKHFNKMQNLE